jgi:hypothetical protein
LNDIDAAIDFQNKAIAVAPHHDTFRSALHIGLRIWLQVWFNLTENADDFQEAVQNFHMASQSEYSVPAVCFHALSSLAGMTHNAGDFNMAVLAYRDTISMLPLAAWIGLSADEQLNQLTEDSQILVCDTAACAIKLTDCHRDLKQQHLGDTLELLDHGRSVMWSQPLNIRSDMKDLQAHDSALAEELNCNACVLAANGFHDSTQKPPTEQEGQACRCAADAYTKLMEEI